MNIFIKQETKNLCNDMIKNYRNWSQNHYTIFNSKTNKHIWVANTVFCIDFHPFIGAFNIFEKFFVHRAIKKCNVLNAIDYQGESYEK